MSRIIRIKNNSGIEKTWVGQTIQDGYYFTIPGIQRPQWEYSEIVLKDILDGYAVVNDGNADLDSLQGIDWLKEIEPARDLENHLIVSESPRIGSRATIVSHNFCDPCSWYEQSIREDGADGYGETLTPINDGYLTYNSDNTNWIDLQHGRITMEHRISNKNVEVTVDGTNKNEDEDFTVDYESGQITFDEALSAENVVKAIYNYENGSEFTVSPTAGKKLRILYTEIQFGSTTVITSPIHFEVWVYNPYDLPNKAQYGDSEIYKNVRDVINISNGGVSVGQFSDLKDEIKIFPFKYTATTDLKSSKGAEIRIHIQDDIQLDGYYGTITAYCLSEDE